MTAVESARDRVLRIIKLVAPFCWVPLENAGRIPSFLVAAVRNLRHCLDAKLALLGAHVSTPRLLHLIQTQHRERFRPQRA
jgi:hypothetical protein